MVSEQLIKEILGKPKVRLDDVLKTNIPGVVTGTCLDAGRRRYSIHRGFRNAGRGETYSHWTIRRCYEGVGSNIAEPYRVASGPYDSPI